MIKNTWKVQCGDEIQVTESYYDYDPDLSSNGGSYFQPSYECVAPFGKLSIDDNSCGEFGSRISATIFDADGVEQAYANWGSMLSSSEKYTNADYGNDVIRFWCDFAWNELKYYIPVLGEEV
jgi:hypothetical protein